MTTHRFYVPDLIAESESARLSTDQSRQASRVLRLRTGDPVTIFDGRGWEYTGRLAGQEGDRWTVAIDGRRQPGREPAMRLTIGLSVIRNERFDMAVQKLTELGAAAIVPILAERCVISYKDERAWQNRRQRIERIVIESAEQSERTTLPAIDNPQTLEEFFERRSGQTVIAFVERENTRHISDIEPSSDSVSLLIGPEGGWTGDEIQLIEHHAVTASLGRLILRAETAAIAAASYLTFASGAAND